MKQIQVTPKDAETSRKIDLVVNKLKLRSRSAFVAVALDFVLPRLESGEAQIINGELVLATGGKRKAA